MGYRYIDRTPPVPDDLIPVLDMYNDEIRTWSFPCFYLDVEKPIDWHDYKLHDHIGWPDPRHPGHICQALPDYEPYKLSPAAVWKYVDMSKAVPIHLTSADEGYNGIHIDHDDVDHADEVSADAIIRSEEDWIVDVTFHPSIEVASGDPDIYVIPFTIYLVIYGEGSEKLRQDVLARVKLAVVKA